MLRRLVELAVSMALVLGVYLAVPEVAQAGWDFSRTPAWSSGRGGPVDGSYSGYGRYSGYSGYSAPYYPAARPGVAYAAPTYVYGLPFGGMMVSSQQENTRNELAVQINIRVPANAKIWFDGKETKQGGTSRNFVSPALEPGSSYSYDIRVTWKDGDRTVERKRHLMVHAGDQLNLNLSLPSRSATATSETEGQ